MLESYFEIIENPITKQIRALQKENQKQQTMIGKVLMESSEVINQLKKEINKIKQENNKLIKERNDFYGKYNNLKRITKSSNGINNNLKKIIKSSNGKNKTPVSKGIRERVFERDKNKCLLCGTTKNLTIDHIKPRAMGGSNKIDNLQTLCKRCNLVKGINLVDYRKVVDCPNNKIEPLIKRKKKTHNEFNFTEFGMLEIKI